jgi:hypothetical protein
MCDRDFARGGRDIPCRQRPGQPHNWSVVRSMTQRRTMEDKQPAGSPSVVGDDESFRAVAIFDVQTTHSGRRQALVARHADGHNKV